MRKLPKSMVEQLYKNQAEETRPYKIPRVIVFARNIGKLHYIWATTHYWLFGHRIYGELWRRKRKKK